MDNSTGRIAVPRGALVQINKLETVVSVYFNILSAGEKVQNPQWDGITV